MTKANEILLALDVGGVRIGVAKADSSVKIAHPVTTIDVNGHEIERITELVNDDNVTKLVVGYPRNQAGETTEQTAVVEVFAERLKALAIPVVFQDESLTSVLAEQRLKSHTRSYTKGMIDAEAAAIILQDYMEMQYGY